MKTKEQLKEKIKKGRIRISKGRFSSNVSRETFLVDLAIEEATLIQTDDIIDLIDRGDWICYDPDDEVNINSSIVELLKRIIGNEK